MKKIIAYAVLLCVAAALIGPKVIGATSKGKIDNYVDLINKNDLYDLSWKDYDNGWFGSEGTLQVTLTVPGFAALAPGGGADTASGLNNITFDVHFDMQHGPVLGSTFGLSTWRIEVVKPQGLGGVLEWDESLPLYGNSGGLGLFGDMHYSEQIPRLKILSDSDTSEFTFSGYQGSGTVENGRLVYSGSSKGAELAGPEGKFHFGDVTATGEFEADFAKIVSGELYNMDMSITFASMAADDESDFEIENVVLTVNSTVRDDGKVADMTGGYAIKKIAVGDTLITEAGVDVVIENYSAEFNKRYTELAPAALTGGNAEAANAEMLALMEEALPLLLAENPTLKLQNLRFSLPEGTFKGSAEINLDGVTALPADPADMAFWLEHTIMSASLAADKALAERLAVQVAQVQVQSHAPPDTTPEQLAEAARQQGPMMLGMLGQQGMLVEDAGQYRLDFSYNKGETVLNGNPIELPIEALLGGQ